MRNFFLGTAVLLAACGGKQGPADAGRTIDTSCGIDCEAQTHYGLLPGSCIEFTDTTTTATPPALGVLVSPVFTVEDGVKVMPVEYRRTGQVLMKDSFTITKEGDLKLIRRELQGGQSVSYQDDAGVLVGATWLTLSTASGNKATSKVQADVLGRPGGRTKEATSVEVSALDPIASELNTPRQVFDGGITLLFGETPDHATDSRRTFVDGEGFVLIATPLGFGNTPIPYRQQKRHDTDGGFLDCSL